MHVYDGVLITRKKRNKGLRFQRPVPDSRLNCQYSKKNLLKHKFAFSDCVIRFQFLKCHNPFNRYYLALLCRANKRNDGSVWTIRNILATHLSIKRCSLKLSLYSSTFFMTITCLHMHNFSKTPYTFAQNMFT